MNPLPLAGRLALVTGALVFRKRIGTRHIPPVQVPGPAGTAPVAGTA